MPKPYTGSWTTDFFESGNHNQLFEYIGAIAMLRTNLHIQIYRLETQLLGKKAPAICGFCSSIQGNSEHSKTVRNAIKKITHQSIWLRYTDLISLADSAIEKADLFIHNLWARNPKKPASFIMIKTRTLMNWHLKHSQMIRMPNGLDARDKPSISAFEYTESEFIDLQTILSFISTKTATFIIEYESARGFVDRFKVSSRSNTQ